jgi:hypothetical protein
MIDRLKVAGVVVAAVALVLVAPRLIHYLSPLGIVLHGLVYVLSALAAAVSVPWVAYRYANKTLDGSERVVAIVVAMWVACALTEPNAKRVEEYTVYGKAGLYSREAISSHTCFCFEDAKAHARQLLKNRQEWSRDEEGRFQECDVVIEEYRYMPALEWINGLLGAHYGHDHSRFSIRYLDHREDPLNIMDLYEHDDGRDEADRYNF